MDPRDFNELAEELSGGTRACEFRSAISRAYYAAFHVAVRTLRGFGFSVARAAAGHGEVQRLLANSTDPELVRIGFGFAKFRRMRNEADYDLDKTYVETADAAHGRAEAAKMMIAALDACNVEPRRSAIIAGINAHLDKLRPQP